jgi:hypothetical protein
MKKVLNSGINLFVGQTLLVQEPTQRFSHDCVIVHELREYHAVMKCANGDSNDGKLLYYSYEFLNSSKVKCI